MKQELFEQCFELEDIDYCNETGYNNVYDLTVSGEHSFVLGNGVVSHNSALGGVLPVLGRKECGYYELKGVPLNAYSADQSKFTSNKELSELFKLIQNEKYTNIIFGTDADFDGFHIQGLLMGFIHRYLPEFKGKVGVFQTPVIVVTKGKTITRWYYDLTDDIVIKKGETSNYVKGLGTWDTDDLKHIVEQEGLQKMFRMIDFNDIEVIDDWLGNNATPRKGHLLNNEFSITQA